jgi:hypothetical protein
VELNTLLKSLFLGPLNKPNTQSDSAMDIDVSSTNPKSDQIQSLTQLILSLDMEQWENLVEVFHIQTSMINTDD